jgi:hypothetical protein
MGESVAPSQPLIATADEPAIKGIALRNFPGVIASLFDEATARRVLEALPDELARALRDHLIVSSRWYPIHWYRDLHAATRAVTRSGPALARRIGRESTVMDMNGVYRVFLRVLSPHTILSLAGRVFSTYYRYGKMSTTEMRDGFARVEIHGAIDFDEAIWLDVLGGSEGTLELCGAKNLRVHILEGGRDGDDHLVVRVHWT